MEKIAAQSIAAEKEKLLANTFHAFGLSFVSQRFSIFVVLQQDAYIVRSVGLCGCGDIFYCVSIFVIFFSIQHPHNPVHTKANTCIRKSN
jgi:hypothetical protein